MLQALALECVRKRRVLFRSLSFSISGGERLRIAGANGSGKTSLLRILAGLLTPHAGEVRWKGAPIQSLREEYARHIVYLGHAAALKDELSARENLEFACRLSRLPSGAEEALLRFGVPPASFAKELSQGQKRRAGLARLVLAESSSLWLLDEPFTALDAAGVELLKELIEAHLRRGGMVAYTTHQDPGLAPGRVVELG